MLAGVSACSRISGAGGSGADVPDRLVGPGSVLQGGLGSLPAPAENCSCLLPTVPVSWVVRRRIAGRSRPPYRVGRVRPLKLSREPTPLPDRSSIPAPHARCVTSLSPAGGLSRSIRAPIAACTGDAPRALILRPVCAVRAPPPGGDRSRRGLACLPVSAPGAVQSDKAAAVVFGEPAHQGCVAHQ